MNGEKIKVWNWQKIHNKAASVQDWVYKMLMAKRITVLDGGAVKILLDGSIAGIGDYLVWFEDTDELKAIGKDDFELNYERMT